MKRMIVNIIKTLIGILIVLFLLFCFFACVVGFNNAIELSKAFFKGILIGLNS